MSFYRMKPPLGAQINCAHPLARGLVGFWLFNEGGGDKAYDLSGYGNHGTLTNMAFPPTVNSGWIPAKFGTGLSFDGTDDYVSITDNSSLDISDEITLEVWVYLTSYPTNDTAFVGKYRNYGMGIKGTTHVLSYHEVGNTVGLSVVPLNQWNHLVVTAKNIGDEVKFYMNGELNRERTDWTVNLTTNNNSLGIGYDETFTYLNGLIDQVRIYNRALSATEIRELYTNPFGMFTNPFEIGMLYTPPIGGLSIPVAMSQYGRLRV